jgi:hypothetical protein
MGWTILTILCRDESFTFHVGPDTKSLHLEVFDHKTIGKDKSIGQIDIPVRSLACWEAFSLTWFKIWERLQFNGSSGVPSAQISSELTHGVGQLTVRLEFDQSSGSLGARAASIGSLDRPGIGSPSRFSMRKAKSPAADA